MKKLLGIVVLGLLSVSCSEKVEKYFANCVKDGKKYVNYPEAFALKMCKYHKQHHLDEFKYYKGKIFSKNNKDALTPDEKSKMWDKILKKINKNSKK